MKTLITILLLAFSLNVHSASLPDVSSWTTEQLKEYDHEKQFKPCAEVTDQICRDDRMKLRLESHAVRGELIERQLHSSEINSCGSVGCIKQSLNTVTCYSERKGDVIQTECF